ncbi:MAG TPA: alpha-ketoglutarate-dependent dioxygenase AlkB [Candidatus Baltobacteraceae bacterium]|nr:alpha-ketoglutarate-dependent dioxygenase AlkB [Candidatus Baltobacteraceae bacterium]
MYEQTDIFAATVVSSPVLRRSGELPADFVIAPEFVTKAEEVAVLNAIDSERWNVDLKRRVQQYGFRYDYKARAVSACDRLGDLPPWATEIAQRLVDCEYFESVPDQVIVNEYLPGQGINAHTDRTTCFGPAIASLSLGSDVVMDFSDSSGKRGSILLPRRSVLVLRGASRVLWKHAIAQRRMDTIGGFCIERKRRVSLTFRSVVLTD